MIKHEPDGLHACLPAGEVARHLNVPQNTMSSHLSILAPAGLMRAERHGRSVIYRADLDQLREMMLFLVKDCCGGRAELCEPLIASLMPCCSTEPKVLQ